MAETVVTINRLLRETFGIDTVTGIAIWRVVFADDQYEKRMTDTTDTGIQLLTPEVRLMPKYPWIRGKWVLERLVLVPEINQEELVGQKLSYEPIWPFEDKDGNPLPPKWAACKFVVDTVYAALGKQSLAKYKDPDQDGHAEDRRQERVKQIEEELFGDESGLLNMTNTGQGIVVPQNFETTQKKE